MIASQSLLVHKFASVIKQITADEHIPLRDAMDRFYKSIVYKEMSEGIANMHCRSDIWLAEEIRRELDN